MPTPLERRRDVLKPERFDPEERTEAKPIVTGYWSQQQDVHIKSSEAIIQLSDRSSACRETWWNRF
jgi:hypothetical protein